jgi:hypothetical protein
MKDRQLRERKDTGDSSNITPFYLTEGLQ